jgi:phosphatidylglycerol:prolipoprotein diacylglycerol transferase
LIIAAAAASGFYLAMKRSKIYGLEPKQAEDILFWVIVGGFVGARLYHVFSSAPYYWQHPADIFKVWNGGLSIYGAVFGGILTLIALQKIYNLKSTTLNLLDWLAPSVLLGQIIGRFGNLFNYEAFGYPTNLPWKMFVPVQFRPADFITVAYYHPFFLYELLGNLIILFILLKVFKFSKTGVLFFSYVLLYNSLRFCLEFLRIDSTFIGVFRLNAIASLVILLASAAGLVYVRKNPKTA